MMLVQVSRLEPMNSEQPPAEQLQHQWSAALRRRRARSMPRQLDQPKRNRRNDAGEIAYLVSVLFVEMRVGEQRLTRVMAIRFRQSDKRKQLAA